MRRLAYLFPAFLLGCHAAGGDVAPAVENCVAAVAPVRATLSFVPCAAAEAVPALADPLDLASLWQAAVAHNPELREAAAELEAARGRFIQAGKYPNPRLIYEQDTIGATQAPEGNFKIEASQELVTAGKRRLDKQVNARATDRAGLALLGRKFAVLSHVRRAYYDYVNRVATEHASEEVIAALQQGLELTRQRIKAGARPETDALRLEALLEESRVSLANNRAAREGAWRQLLAEAGLPEMPMAAHVEPLGPVPRWQAHEALGRVRGANTALKEAAVEVERTRLAARRAEAEAVPNITVGAGYVNNRIENATGAVVTVEAPLPLWDRKQGLIHEARADWAKAEAALHSTEHRLTRETAAAFASYEAARAQVERQSAEILPRLRRSLELLRRGYEAGSKEVSFADVLQAEQALAAARLSLAEARRTLWLAVADLQGLMQLDLDEEPAGAR